MGDYEKTICELYDNCPSRYQIKAVAKMYNIDPEEVERILKDNGRELPKPGRKAKLTTKKSDPKEDPFENEKASVDAALEESENKNMQKNIPEAVKNCVSKRVDDIDQLIADYESKIAELEDYINKLSQEYKVLADFIKD